MRLNEADTVGDTLSAKQYVTADLVYCGNNFISICEVYIFLVQLTSGIIK